MFSDKVEDIQFLSIYLGEIKMSVYKKMYTKIAIATVFTIAKAWNQPRCPWTKEWINKFWQNHTTEYYSSMKRSTFPIHTTPQINLICILLSKRANYERAHVVWFLLHEILEQTKLIHSVWSQNSDNFERLLIGKGQKVAKMSHPLIWMILTWSIHL